MTFLFFARSLSLKSNTHPKKQHHKPADSLSNHFVVDKVKTLFLNLSQRKYQQMKMKSSHSFFNSLCIFILIMKKKKMTKPGPNNNDEEALLCFTPVYRSILMLMWVSFLLLSSFVEQLSFTFFSSHKLRQPIVLVGGR